MAITTEKPLRRLAQDSRGVDDINELLLRRAKDPADPLARMFAKVIAYSAEEAAYRRPALGLACDRFSRLLGYYFPGAEISQSAGAAKVVQAPDCATCHMDEFDDLVKLLLEHRSDDDEATVWFAHAIAAGCMSDNHLWQDLGLPSRETLSDLLRTHFASLYRKNTRNMKWKKFFYKQLCMKADITICKAPSCSVCSDYRSCFGPEGD